MKKLFYKLESLFNDKIVTNEYFNKIFLKNKLFILDIGASGIPEKNKFNYSISKEIAKIYKFDNEMSNKAENDVLINKILWSEEKKIDFHINKNQQASSLFKVNSNLIKNFDNFNDHQNIEIKKILTSKLSNIDQINKIDFVKIDTEGAELEILKGMENKIDNVLGFELEIQFIERYIGSPTFSQIDKFLKDHNFDIYIINQETWIRNKKIKSSASNHKVIWADTVYFKNINEIKKDNQNNSAEKLIFMLVFYKLYDEAFHALDFFVKNNIVSTDQKDYIENFINKNMSSNIVIITKCFFNFFFAIAVFMITSISKKYRQQGISYLKKNFRKLFYSIADTVKFSNKENNTSRDLKL